MTKPLALKLVTIYEIFLLKQFFPEIRFVKSNICCSSFFYLWEFPS